jgi:adenylate cyclase
MYLTVPTGAPRRADGNTSDMSAQTAAAGSELWRTNIRRLTRVAVIANGVGGLLVFLLLSFLIPFAPEGAQEDIPLNAAVGAVYLAVTLVLGSRFGMRASAPAQRWLESGRPPTAEERRIALGQPFRFAAISGFFWTIAAILFTLLNLPDSGWAALVVGGAILLGGETTCAIGYLLAERISRPVTALALAGGAPPDRCGAPGVATRLMTAWSLGTGVPLLGISVIAVASLFDDGQDAGLVAAAVVFLAAIGMSVGLLAISVAARSVAEPLAAVRRAIAQIEEGQLDVVVPVDDGSEVGLLEAGFNRMTAGLREREQLRDLFGRHVGREVARAALENDGEIELGGEVREIAVIFVDMIGSTQLALRRSPADVVTLLNTFFCLVVEVVEEHGGWVNKFEGDAALCVFGAPTPSADHAADALRAARRLRERIAGELSGADASIGVSAGPAVAGNVGARERFEYTVIGDAVNEAARLCELAKQRPGRLLASDAVLERAGRDEVARWAVRDRVVLRGRDRPTGVAEPRMGTRPPDSRRPATLTPAVGS